MKRRSGKGLALIKKSNNLIEARYRFDIWETRLFLSVLGQIHKDDEDFKTYRIQYKDIIKTFELTSNQSYDLLREGASSLMKKPLYANYEINGQHREKQYHIIRSIDYLDGKKEQNKIEDGEYIDVTIDPDMKPLLLQLREQGGFTFYELNNVVKLGVYPLRIYELLKQYQRFGSRKLEIDEMKMMFELTSEYPLFANFYQRVVEPAIKEINQFSDLYIYEVEKVKKGKKITALLFRFNIKVKEEKKKMPEKVSTIMHPSLFSLQKFDVEEIIEPKDSIINVDEPQKNKDELFLLYQKVVVGDFGVSPSVFFTELEKYDKETIEKAIRITQRAENEGKINNLSGFFIEALRKGYNDVEEVKAVKKKIRDDENQKNQEEKLQLENDLLELEQMIIKEENTTIRQLVAFDESAREKAIEKAKEIIMMNSYYKNELAKKGYDSNLDALEIQIWREDELLRVLVIEGFKIVFPNEFEHLYSFRMKKQRLEKRIREIGKG